MNIRLLSLMLCIFLLSGCSFGMDAPEETQKIPEYTVPEVTLSTPLTYSKELLNDQGQVLALYSASFAQFTCSDSEFAAPGRINKVFYALLQQCDYDAESFLNHCKTQLGENWAKTQSEAPVYSTTIDYDLTACPEDYICIYSTYTLNEKGNTLTYPSAYIFLSETGWHLTFSSLFGDNAEKAFELTISGLKSYCTENNIPLPPLESIDYSYLNEMFGIDGKNVFVCFDPFFFSYQSKDLVRIELPITDFLPLLTENIY